MTYVNNTGLPSVTTIISPYIDKEWFDDESRRRGENVHAACAAYAMGLFVVDLPYEHQGYFESFKQWFELMSPTPIMVEKRLVDEKMGYCGQLDFAFKTDTNTLVDFKTSQSHQNWWVLQYSAYKHLFEVNTGERIKSGGCLRLRQDGGLPIFDQMPGDTRKAFNVFTGLLNAHKFFNQ